MHGDKQPILLTSSHGVGSFHTSKSLTRLQKYDILPSMKQALVNDAIRFDSINTIGTYLNNPSIFSDQQYGVGSIPQLQKACIHVHSVKRLTPLLSGWACYKWARDFRRFVQNISSREELQHPPSQPPLYRGEEFFLAIKIVSFSY